MEVKELRIPRKNILEQRWLQEILIVATLFILFTLNEWIYITKWNDLWRGLCYFGILYAHAQTHRFLVLPILLDRHRPMTYALSTVIWLLAFAAILHAVSILWIYPDCFLYKSAAQDTFIFHVATVAISLIAMLTPFLVLRFYREQKNRSLSQLCMNEMELKLLRSQLNPHFLFNTFNNLYGISLKEPTRVPDLILQVSKLMRYQLDSSSKSWVPLRDELEFIESYISLEEERVGRRCDIQYEFQNHSPEKNNYIAPMMLGPFIENAFKHGSNSMESCFVHMRISVKNSWLEMEIRNSIPKNIDSSQVSTGIGLQNTQQRLNILYPGKQHRLSIHTSDTEYTVNLALHLNVKNPDGGDDLYLSYCR